MANKFEKKAQVERVSAHLSIGQHLAKELLILAGGDEDLVIESSLASDGLDQCKARIVDGRMSKNEQKTDEAMALAETL